MTTIFNPPPTTSLIKLDRIDTLRMVEENGVIRKLTRKARISSLPQSTVANPLSFDQLLAAYTAVGLPTPGSILTGTTPARSLAVSQLVLAKRTFELVEGDSTTVDVTMEYEHFMDGDNQNLTLGNPPSPNGWVVPSNPNSYGKNKASVQQTKTNFFDCYYDNSLPPGGLGNWSRTASYAIGDIVDYQGFFWVCKTAQAPAYAPDSQGNLPPFAAWNNNIPYDAGLCVSFGGFVYNCTSPNIGNTPPDPLFWALVTPSDCAPPPGPIVNGVPTPIGRIWALAQEGVDYVNNIFPPALPIRRQISVGHQFPLAPSEKQYPGQTLFQTGEVTIMQPNENFKLHGQIFTRNPQAVKNQLTGAINSLPWRGGLAYQWMCTAVEYEPMFVVFGQWKFTFEFQKNLDGWLPTPIFNDQRIGRPPAGLRQGFGYYQMHLAVEIDFNQYLLANLRVIADAN